MVIKGLQRAHLPRLTQLKQMVFGAAPPDGAQQHAGMDDYLAKPVEPELLLNTIKRFLIDTSKI